jgi:hypothetical protein
MAALTAKLGKSTWNRGQDRNSDLAECINVESGLCGRGRGITQDDRFDLQYFIEVEASILA